MARATRPCRRATGPAEAGTRLLANALRRNFSPSLSVPVGESPTGTGESPVLPNQNGAALRNIRAWVGIWDLSCLLAILPEMAYVEFALKNTLTVAQAQAQFPALCRKDKTSAITRNGEVVAFIVPRKRMAGLLEQMEILANPEAMAAIERAKVGKTVDHPLNALDEADRHD